MLTWLDEGVDSAGERYLEMRRRLVSYFDRKRCAAPDDLADETLNRVARRLEEEGAIPDAPPRYCYIVARFVFMEWLRQADRQRVRLSAVRGEPFDATLAEADADDRRERLLDCLDRCLQRMDARDRDLIVEYYRGEERAKIECRRGIAARLHVTANALTIRACRIRNRLEACVNACADRK